MRRRSRANGQAEPMAKPRAPGLGCLTWLHCADLGYRKTSPPRAQARPRPPWLRAAVAIARPLHRNGLVFSNAPLIAAGLEDPAGFALARELRKRPGEGDRGFHPLDCWPRIGKACRRCLGSASGRCFRSSSRRACFGLRPAFLLGLRPQLPRVRHGPTLAQKLKALRLVPELARGLWSLRLAPGLRAGRAWGVPASGLALAGLLPLPSWLDVSVAYTAQPLLSLGGGQSLTSTWVQLASLQLTLSTGLNKNEAKWTERDRWTLTAVGSQMWGDSGMASSVGAIFPLQSTALAEKAYLSQLTLERKAPLGGLGVRLGWLSLDPDLFQAPAYAFYVHSALNATYNINVPGYQTSPNSSLSALLTYRPSPNTDLRYGLYGLNSNLRLTTYGAVPRTPFSNLEGSLQVLQLQHHWPGDDRRLQQRQLSSQLPDGLLQLGGFLSSSKATPLTLSLTDHRDRARANAASVGRTSSLELLPSFAPPNNPGIVAGPSQGAYANLTVPIELPFGLAHRLYGGMLTSFSPATNPVSLYGQVGWLAQGMIPSRPQDVLVLGYGRSVFSPVLGLQDESVLELGYQIPLGPHLTLQPTLQWIFNAGGQAKWSTVSTAGLQIELQF